MDDRIKKVSEILHRAAETHHVVFAITDGEDPDWASWYSEWLTTLSELPAVLGAGPVRSELTAALVALDLEYGDLKPAARWEDHYAARLVERFGSPLN